MGIAHDLRLLLRSRQPLLVIETVEEARGRDLVIAAAGALDLPAFEWSVTRGFTPADRPEAVNRSILAPSDVLAHIAEMRGPLVVVLKDLHHHLADARVARSLREALEALQRSGSTAVVLGSGVELPAEVDALAATIVVGPPDRAELTAVVTAVLEDHGAAVRLDASGRRAVIDALTGLTAQQARQAVTSAVLEDGHLTAADIPHLLDRKARLIADDGVLEYHPAADNPFRLGGFDGLKAWLGRARAGFTDRARELGLPAPRGILIVGVPGCGKSLAAKVIAREWGLPLLKLDAGRLLDKYVGESERNLRRAFDMAAAMSPAVLWIDEIEKGMVPAGGDGDGGVSRRLFGAFLTWLQEERGGVFVVATANDLSAVPPELLRKGRFDEVFFADLPEPAERAEILGIHLRLRRQDPAAFDLPALVAASEGFSGAEIEAATVAALYGVVARDRALTTADVLRELSATIPLSVTRAEDVRRLRETARGRFVPVRGAAPARAA